MALTIGVELSNSKLDIYIEQNANGKEDCQEAAVYYAEETVLAYKAAAKEMALYNEKYGEK